MLNNTQKSYQPGMKKVLFIGPFPPPYGGIANHTNLLYTSELQYIFNLSKIDLNKHNNNPEIVSRKTSPKIGKLLWGLSQIIKHRFNNKYDVIYLKMSGGKSCWREFFYMLIIKKIFRSKVVLHFHGMFKQFPENYPFTTKGKTRKLSKLLINIIFYPAHQVIFLSETILRDFREILSHYNNNKSTFINHFVDSQNYPEYHKKDKTDIIKIIYLGRLSSAKGFFDALEALHTLYLKNYKFHFHICGAPEDDATVFQNELYKNLLANNRITYHGIVYGKNKYRILAEGDILLFPSHNEVFPNVILEGLAASLPIVSTNVGVIPEILLEGQNALICNPGDIKQLTVNMELLLRSNKMRLKMSQNNRKLSIYKFDIDLAINKLIEVFNS